MQAVSDAAAGGAVLLSEASYVQLPMESLWDKALVMHIGACRTHGADVPLLQRDCPHLPAMRARAYVQACTC